MNYNTTREGIEMREYGRHIQRMIEYAITIENREERQKVAEQIIQIMVILNPQLKNSVDYKNKLWDHLFIISKFQLDVDSPYPIPTEETARIKPADVPYPKNGIKYKHYGKNVESMIQKAIALDNHDKQQEFIEIIGNFMKLAYKNWSNEEVNNELVKHDMKTLSGGVLEISDDMNIETMTKLHRSKSQQHQYQNRNRNNNNNNRNNRNGHKNRNNKRYK